MENPSRSKAKEILKLIKVRFTERSVAFVWSTIIGLLVASRVIPNPLHLVYAFLITFFVGTAVYVYNEVTDYKFDKINRVNRPIATDSVTRKEGLLVALVLLSLGILLSTLINLETLLLSATFFLLGFLYSTPPIRLKNRFLMKQIITAIGGFITCLIGGTIVGNISLQVIYLGFIFFLLIIANSPIADIADLRGDMVGRVKSITVVYGPKFAIKFAIVVEVLMMILTALVYPYVGFNILTPITLTLGLLIFIWLAYTLRGRFQNVNYCRKVIKKLIAVNFFLQLSFILGVLPII